MITLRTETITPAKAIAWLSLSEEQAALLQKQALEQRARPDMKRLLQGTRMLLENQRPINRRRVQRLLVCLQNGEWNALAAVVHITPDGRCIGGQHRLLAIVLYGKPVDCLVNRQAEAIADLDWSLADWLAYHGVPAARNAAATFQWFAAMEESQAQPDPRWPVLWSGASTKAAADRIVEHDDGKLRRLIDRAVCWARGNPQLGTGSVLSGLHVYLHHSAPTSAAAFFAGLADPTTCHGPGDPRAVLARRLQREAVMHSAERERTSDSEMAALIVSAWNAYLVGRSIEKIQTPRLVRKEGKVIARGDFPRVLVRRQGGEAQTAAKVRG